MTSILFVCVNLFTLSASQSFEIWNISLPFKMQKFGAGIFDNKLSVFSGEARQKSNNDRVNLTSSYSLPLSPLSSTWSNHSNINLPFYAYQITYGTSASVQINDLIYGIGPFIADRFGTNLHSYISMLIYNLKTNSYENVSTYNYTLPYAMAWHCVVTDNTLIYSIGGGTQIKQNITSIYNTSDSNWHIAAPINVARSAAGCSFDISSKYIYLFSGIQGAGTNMTKIIEQYDVMTDKWSILDGVLMPYYVYFPFCILYRFDKNIWCIGGNFRGVNGWTDRVQIFNTTEYSFHVIHLNEARNSMDVVLYNDCMLVLGGYGNAGLLSSIETMNCHWIPKTECSWSTNDGLHTLNLTDVSGATISGTSAEFIYGYTPCTNDLLCNNTNVMAFELNLKSLVCLYYLAIWESTTNNIPSYNPQNQTWQFVYITKNECNGNDVIFEIYWICNLNAGLYNLLQSKQMGPCTYFMTIESKLACS